MRRVSWGMFFVLALMLAMAQQRPAHAGIINGSVSLDTSGLSGTFELGFIVTDGSATGDANNTVTLGNFGFGGGSAGAVDPLLTTSGASGDFASGVTLTDSRVTPRCSASDAAAPVSSSDGCEPRRIRNSIERHGMDWSVLLKAFMVASFAAKHAARSLGLVPQTSSSSSVYIRLR